MIKKLQEMKRKRGFTLVELIVVIAIIGVLAAILVPTLLGYVTSSKVGSANSTAANIKKNVDAFMTSADTGGYGMFKDNTNTCTFDITISGAAWTLTRTGGTFGTSGVLKWDAAGAVTGTAGQSVATLPNYETVLASSLADLYPEISQGSVFLAMKAGKCVAVAFTPEKSTALVSGTDYPALVNGEMPAVFAWDGNNQGISTDGIIIGTAPVVNMGANNAPGT